jgi:hypothetical protein
MAVKWFKVPEKETFRREFSRFSQDLAESVRADLERVQNAMFTAPIREFGGVEKARVSWYNLTVAKRT